MSLESLINDVLEANRSLPAHRLVTLTWGNVSGVDRERGVLVIKPSGVAYEGMTAADMVVVDLGDGSVVAGERRPSTDTPTHLALYRAFEEIGGVCHTHSTWAATWAQAQRDIPLLGTTHADLTSRPIPVTRQLTPEEIAEDYEGHTGTVLIETVAERGGPAQTPCALVRSHGPFCWAADAAKSVQNAVTLEEVARMALFTTLLHAAATTAEPPPPLDAAVRNKHFERKHGSAAYYGQP